VPHVFRGRFVAIMTIQQKEGILVSDCEVFVTIRLNGINLTFIAYSQTKILWNCRFFLSYYVFETVTAFGSLPPGVCVCGQCQMHY
jgi:hypothetical protein